MKLFKWHLIDDIELRCYENGLVRELKQIYYIEHYEEVIKSE